MTEKPKLTLAVSNQEDHGIEAVGSPPVPPAELKRRQFLDLVVERLGKGRKSDQRAGAEAALEVLGEALRNGQELRLPGLGKVKIEGTRQNADRHIVTARIVMDRTPDDAATDALDPPGEDG